MQPVSVTRSIVFLLGLAVFARASEDPAMPSYTAEQILEGLAQDVGIARSGALVAVARQASDWSASEMEQIVDALYDLMDRSPRESGRVAGVLASLSQRLPNQAERLVTRMNRKTSPKFTMATTLARSPRCRRASRKPPCPAVPS